MKAYTVGGFSLGIPSAQERQLREDQLKLRGTERAPGKPRDLLWSGGKLTWNTPADNSDVTGWQVAKDTESNIVFNTADVSVRQYVTADTGTFNLFVRSLNALGVASPWVQKIVTA